VREQAPTKIYTLSLHDALPICLVQASVLEIHPWGSTVADVERADRMIFDLDPGPGLSWGDVIAAASELRDLLRETGNLESFVKRSEEHTSELQSRENIVCRLLL